MSSSISSPQQSQQQPPLSSQDLHSKITSFESFIHDKLKPDLKKTLDQRDLVYDTISDYLKLRNQIEILLKAKKGEDVKEKEKKENEGLKTMVDLGSNFYVQAKIPDTSHIFINIGFGFHAQLSLHEALIFIDKKEELLNKQAENLTKKAADIRAHIQMVLEGLRSLLDLNNEASGQKRYDPGW